MLLKLSLSRLKDRQSDLEAIAKKMETINDARLARLVEINADRDHTLAWKTTMSQPLVESPELVALNAQARLITALMEEQKGLWRNSAFLLRSVAVPERTSPSGGEVYSSGMAELDFLLREADLLATDSAALQAALDGAVLAQDWRRVYAYTLGRIDAYGRALPSASGLLGTPLDCLALPERDDAEEVFFACDLARIRCEGVMLCLSSKDMNPTALNSSTNLVRESSLAIARRTHDAAIKQRDRLRAAPSALERWELLKDGAPEQPTFDDQVAAAVERARHSNLEPGYQVPK